MSVRSPLYTGESILDLVEQSWSRDKDWPNYIQTLQAALRSGEPGSPQPLPVFLLPGLCCLAAGGDPQCTVGAAAAWVLLYTAAHLLDDVEDGDVAEDAAQTINIATGLIFTAVRVLADERRSAATDQDVLQTIDDFASVVLQMCGSQHADLVEPNPSLERCWRIVEAKSGAYFALACRTGAMLAKAPEDAVRHYSQFGYHFGILLQISDDLRGVQSAPGNRSDLAAGKWSLPIVYALTVSPPETSGRLLQYLQAALSDPVAESAARRLIEAAGTALYLAIEAERHYRGAEAALHSANPSASAREQLLELLKNTALSRRQRGRQCHD